jgi:quinoprotein glucose dehydrogenase
MRLILSNDEPTANAGSGSPIITPDQKAKLMAGAKAAAAKGPVRYTSPYDFMQSPSNGLTPINTPWSELTAYDLNTGEIKWRIPDGGVTAPAELGIKADSGAHMPRGGPLVTAGGLVFVATASDRTVRAYDRENGKVVWSKDLPTGSEGVPATYEVGGRQFIVFPVAAGAGLFPPRFGGPAPQRGAQGGGPEAEAGGVRGRGRGGAAQQPGAYIAYALPKK